MPIVQRMVDGSLGTQPQGTTRFAQSIAHRDGAEISDETYGNVLRALRILDELVEDSPEAIPVDALPGFEVHPPRVVEPTGFFSFLKKQKLEKYRANARRATHAVSIAEGEQVATIVHEVGHQIEYHLPVECWRDIHALLRARDRAGGGLVPIYPDHPNAELRQEAARDCDMPATGLYSAKAYADGATEVMSMTMEYFCTPDKARDMIDRDPLQAAIILRMLQPTQFRATIPSALRELLPRGDVSARPLPLD